jgi:arylsulfatase A-like enzyme
MCLQLLEIDRDLGDFLDALDSTGVDYAVALTADHGGADIPERLRAKGVPDAASIDPALAPKAVSDTLARQLGINGPVLHADGPVGNFYLDARLSAADRQRVLTAAVAFYRAQPQIYGAYTKHELASVPVPTGSPVDWPVIQRVRASFDPERSGDLYVVAKPHIMPIIDPTGSVSTHGSPWDYDRRVPILFWRPGFRGTTIEAPVETTAIMPTLAALVGLSLPAGSVDGHCVDGTPAFCEHP